MKDPMTSYEQAEAESDERFYEERADADAAIRAAEVQRIRRRARWNAYCRMDHRSPEHCHCIEECAHCGHLAAEHALTEGHRMFAVLAGECERDECSCQRFTSDDE